MESLTVLHADGTAINQAYTDKGDGASWQNIYRFSISLRKASGSINFSLASLPRKLVGLSLANCNLSDDIFPGDLSILPSLQNLNLSGNPISNLPESIKCLTMLQSLELDGCSKLQSLPELPMSLRDLLAKDCTSLERIANLPNLLKSLHLEFFGCDKLVEVKGLFRLEPIRRISTAMINAMGLSNEESTENIIVKLANNMTYTARKTPLQGLYECGIFSIFLPEGKIPYWFRHQSTKTSVSFQVPPCTSHKIKGLNICIVYKCFGSHGFGDVHFLKISNETQGLKWTYSPTFYGIPEAKGKMLWSSHMKIGNQLQDGDEVKVSVRMAQGFRVIECGAHLLYEEQEQKIQANVEGMTLQTCHSNENATAESRGIHRNRAGEHLLCHHRFASHRMNLGRHGESIVSGFDLCFMASANCWPVIGKARPRLDCLWSPKVSVEEGAEEKLPNLFEGLSYFEME